MRDVSIKLLPVFLASVSGFKTYFSFACLRFQFCELLPTFLSSSVFGVNLYISCCLLLVCLLFFVSGSIDLNGAQEKIVRVYEKAPHGTIIRRIGHPGDATNDVTGSRLVGAMIYGKDAAKFAIFEGYLVVDEYPELRGSVTDSFSVKLSLTSQDALRQVTSEVSLRIVVSNRNYFAPRHLALIYTAEVLRYSEPGLGPLLMTLVQDDDVDAYNRDTEFHLSPRSGFLEIGERDGVVRTKGGLHKAPSVIETEVVAMNTGSPPLSSSRRLTVYVRDLSGR